MTRYRKESDQKTIQVSLLLRKIWVIKGVYAYTLSVSCSVLFLLASLSFIKEVKRGYLYALYAI